MTQIEILDETVFHYELMPFEKAWILLSVLGLSFV